MKTLNFSFLLVILLLATTAPALAQEPPPGYAREMNEWYDVCDKDSLDPDSSDFTPGEDLTLVPAPIYPYNGAFTQITDLNSGSANPFYSLFYYFQIASIPAPIDQEQLVYDYIGRLEGANQCFWNAYVYMPSAPGVHTAKTPRKDFSHNIEYADVSFMFYYDDLELIGLLQWRPYKIVVRWDDGLEDEIEGSIDTSLDDYQMMVPSIDDPAYHAVAGYVSQTIAPRPNHYISAIWLEFDTLRISDLGNWTGIIPAPILLIDKILIRGFYRTQSLPTATPTRTPAPLTPTATPTARPSLWATPTPPPAPSATITPLATKQLPAKYSFVPTSIPVMKLPPWPAVATMAPIPTPATPLALTLLPTPNFPSSSNVPAPGAPTPTPLAWTTNVVSLTTWLQTNSALTNTATFTIFNAPNWYAPSLPRPLANVGYTFESMQSGLTAGQHYSFGAWAGLFGYIASLPIQLIKSVFELFRFMGPFGLFVIWLLVLLPGVLFFKFFEFIKSLIIRLFNFVLDLIGFVLKLIKLLPFV